MQHVQHESQQHHNGHERRRVPLLTKLLGGAALTLALASGIVGAVAGIGHNRSSSNHNQAAHTQVLTEAQLEQRFAQVGKRPIVAPDGKAEFVVAYSNAHPIEADLFVSTDDSSTWQEIAENVGQAGDFVDPTSMPAVWSPNPINGQDVLAVLRQNVDNTPDGDGNVMREYVDLYAVGPHATQEVAEAETNVHALQYNYGDKYGTQNMYAWGQSGNTVIFELMEPVGGQLPDGTYWIGAMDAGLVHAQIPPVNNH